MNTVCLLINDFSITPIRELLKSWGADYSDSLFRLVLLADRAGLGAKRGDVSPMQYCLPTYEEKGERIYSKKKGTFSQDVPKVDLEIYVDTMAPSCGPLVKTDRRIVIIDNMMIDAMLYQGDKEIPGFLKAEADKGSLLILRDNTPGRREKLVLGGVDPAIVDRLVDIRFAYDLDRIVCEQLGQPWQAPAPKPEPFGRKDWLYTRAMRYFPGAFSVEKREKYFLDRCPDKKVAESYLDMLARLQVSQDEVLLLGLGHHIKGNLLALLKELSKPDYAHLKKYVTVKEDNEADVQQWIADYGLVNTFTVVGGTGAYSRLLCTAKYFITEVKFGAKWIKREGQVYLNTWHGTPLKALGLDKKSRGMHGDGITIRDFTLADYLLYPNDHTREHMLWAYRINDLSTGLPVMDGYPRCAALHDGEAAKAMASKLAPNGEKLMVYMPTWQDEIPLEQYVDQTRAFLKAVDEGLKDDQLLYVNLHHRMAANLDYAEYTHIRQFPAWADNYGVLSAAEVLVTDYSSVFFDFLASHKKIILHVPDLKEYVIGRGMYIDMEALPFPKTSTIEELISEMNSPKNYDDTEVYETYCGYDSVKNAENLCRLLVKGDKSAVVTKPLTPNGKKNVLLFSERFQPGESTKRLYEFSDARDREAYNLILSGKDAGIGANVDSAYPLLSDNTIFALAAGPMLAGRHKLLKGYYQYRHVSYKDIFPLLMDSYAKELKRAYGNARFDQIILYETDEPERILSFGAANVPVCLVLQPDMMDAIRRGNSFLKDAIAFFMDTRHPVYTLDPALKAETGKIWGGKYARKVKVISKVDELIQK